MNTNMIEIGKRISEVRNELNLSREKFGNQIGVKNSTIYNLEVARNKTLNEPILIAICTKYGINKNWLLYGEGEKYTESVETLLMKLKNKYDLSNLEFTLLKEYLKLDKRQREIFENYFDNVIKAQSNGDIINTENEIEKFIEEIPNNPNDFENSHIIEPKKNKEVKEFNKKLTENGDNVNKANNDINEKNIKDLG